jgi:hypothetical protein
MPAALYGESLPAHPADVLDRLSGLPSEVASIRNFTLEAIRACGHEHAWQAQGLSAVRAAYN